MPGRNTSQARRRLTALVTSLLASAAWVTGTYIVPPLEPQRLLTHILHSPTSTSASRMFTASCAVSTRRKPRAGQHLPRVRKECPSVLTPVLTKLFSLCFRHGYQPQAWKLANVVPVHKRSSRSQLKNYRPVSLLCVISKVMETIINMQITNYLEGNSLLAANEFGFRRNLGTADALTALHHSWASSIGHGDAACVLAVDIVGAFDKVSHAGVLFKLQQCGILSKVGQ